MIYSKHRRLLSAYCLSASRILQLKSCDGNAYASQSRQRHNNLGSNISHLNLLRALLLRICCSTAVLLTGCSPQHRGTAGRHLYQGFNTSASARPELGQFAALGIQVGRRLEREKDHLTILRVDSDTEEISTGLASGSTDQLERILIPGLKDISPRDNTPTEKFWTRMATSAAQESGERKVVIIFYTDGFSEGTTAEGHRAIQEAAALLAANERVVGVAVVGVRSGTHEEITADLAPLCHRLGDRFVLLPDSDMKSAPLVALLEAAQQ